MKKQKMYKISIMMRPLRCLKMVLKLSLKNLKFNNNNNKFNKMYNF